MYVVKKCLYKTLKLKLVKIRDYSRYSLYQVYEVRDKELVPLYRECFTLLDLYEIAKNHFIIGEEEFE